MTLGGGWQRGNGGGYENDPGRKLRGTVVRHGGDEGAALVSMHARSQSRSLRE